MKFNSRREALMVLGLSEGAGENAIKSAYKTLVKTYHPDVRDDAASARQYQAVSDAYEYLMTHGSDDKRQAVWASDNPQAVGHRVFGTGEELSRMSARMQSRAEYAKREMKAEHGTKSRADEFSKKAKEARQERQYNEAMDRIHTERAAEVMAQMIKAYLYGGKS